MSRLRTPVALFMFKRPDTTARVLDAILAARPERLLVVADGPRPQVAGEAELCEQTRSLIERARNLCQVTTCFADTNLGLRARMSTGIDWVFREVERAILLEDDCLPDPTFFPFCEELLERYAQNPRVMMVSACNFLLGRHPVPDSYYFSRHAHIWGWATWRRAWQLYDVAMSDWPQHRDQGWTERAFESPNVARYMRTAFDRTHSGALSTWDHQWSYALLKHGGLSAVPANHLVTNLGVGADATNTFNPDHSYFLARAQPLALPLRHVRSVEPDVGADRVESDILFTRPPLPMRVWRLVRRRLREYLA